MVMYQWRKMSPAEREDALAWRKLQRRPWHSPRHFESGRRHYLITASGYEHRAYIGASRHRLSEFSEMLLETLDPVVEEIEAWVVLPNHYHAVVLCELIKPALRDLGRLHGKTSFEWNGDDEARGRKVWHRATERALLSDAHHWATLNYVHHNAVKHGYVERWEEWPWSSAEDYLREVGKEEAERIWRAYPVKNMGKGWDW